MRGIPYRRLTSGSLVQFGWGSKQRRIQAAETDRSSAIAESIAQDKELTKKLLHAGGVPVPMGRPVSDADDAWAAAQEVGVPVVVKPLDGNQGKGVSVNLFSKEQVVRWLRIRTQLPPQHHGRALPARPRFPHAGGRRQAGRRRPPRTAACHRRR